MRKLAMVNIVVLLCLMFSSVTEARIFDLTREFFASYFSVSGGTGNFAQSTFLNETTQKTYSYDKSWSNNLSGEFGFSYVMPYLGLRFGLEIFRPTDLKDVAATDTAGGGGSYLLATSITGYAPKITAEFYFVRTSTTRAFFTAYTGTTSVSYKNEYTSVNVTGLSDHSYEAKGSGTLIGGTVGVETFFNDTTTFLIETGYRSLNVLQFNYSLITPTGAPTFNATPVVGDKVLLNDATERTMDLSGYYICLGFRFYM